MAGKTKREYDFRPDELEVFRGLDLELIVLHRPEDLGKGGRSVGKAPLHGGWRTGPAMSVDEAKATMAEGHNVGVRLAASYLVFDVDPRNFEPGDDPVRRFSEDTGFDLESCPTVRTGSGGAHHYARKPLDLDVKDSLDAYRGLEFKTLGRQVVAPGSVHPETLRPYLLDALSPPMGDAPDVPKFVQDLIRRPVGVHRVAPGDRLSPEEVGRLLALLDPTEFRDHDRWLEVMMSCHYASAGEARDEFLEWSTSDPQYSDQGGAIGRRWDSLHGAEPVTTNRKTNRRTYVTERTLYKRVADAGHAHELPPNVSEAVADFEDLDPDEDLQEALSRLPEGSPASGPLERMNAKGYAVVFDGGFSVMWQAPDHEGALRSREGAKPRTLWRRAGRSDFTNGFEHLRIPTEDGRTVCIAEEWLRWHKRRQYSAVVFDPANRIHDPSVLNLWTGFAVEPRRGDWSLLRRLVLEGLCAGDQASFDYVMGWMAFMVQRPDQPAEVSVVFRGKKGTGKSTLGRTLVELFGRHGLQISSQHHFTNHFNAHLRDCVFLFADEAMWAGDKKAEGELKRLITERELVYEAKGKDAVKGPNNLHVMQASNEGWVAPASLEDERRYAVFEVSTKFRGDHEFFDALNRQLENGGYEALLWDLLRHDISGFHPRRSIPLTDALAKQKLQSLDYMDQWWYECLRDADLGTEPLIGDWNSGAECFVAAEQLRESFQTWLGRQGGRHAGRLAIQLSDRLSERVPKWQRVKVKCPSDRIDVKALADGRIYGYWLPSVGECRGHFETLLGASMPWGDEEDEDPLA